MELDTPVSQAAPADPLNHVPDQCETVLILIDVINDLSFDGGEDLFRYALPMADKLAALKRRAKAAGVPVIYANDNFGRWRSDFPALVENCLSSDARGRPFVEKLVPEDDDYFILKPKHSAFFQTNLDLLLKYLGAKQVILTGVAGDICVLFTANDAYMRDFHVIVPSDCVASEDRHHNDAVLELMARVLKAEVRPSEAIEIEDNPLRAKKPAKISN